MNAVAFARLTYFAHVIVPFTCQRCAAGYMYCNFTGKGYMTVDEAGEETWNPGSGCVLFRYVLNP